MKDGLFAELKRRHVYRVAVAYAVVGWLLIEVATQVFPVLHMPEWTEPLAVMFILIGFPIALVLAWAFELTPEGVRRTEPADSPDARLPEHHRHVGRKLDFIIIGVLVVAVALLGWQRWGPRKQAAHVSATTASQAAATPPAATAKPQAGATEPAAPSTSAIPPNSIAVLPFADESPKKDQGYFSDGISEDLLNLLTKVPQLQVTARTSSFYFKGKDVSISDIAKKLHVAHILEGSVQKAGDEIRITAQLVDASTDTQLWSQTWDRKLDDVFKIQDEISGDVVKQLKIRLLGAAPKARTTDPKAYALYVQARELGRHWTAQAFNRSNALYRQVLAIDPRYAPAWDGLAYNFAYETTIGVLSQNQEGFARGFARAREAANKALSIDPDYAPARAALGYVAMYADNDLAAAAKHFERALSLDPTDLDVIHNAAQLLANLGRLDEALVLEEAIVRRDPVDVAALFDLSSYQSFAGHYDAAIATLHTVLSLSPGWGLAHTRLSTLLLLKGDAKGALAEIEQETSDPWRMIDLPVVYYALGRKVDSDQALAALIAKYPKDAPYNIAYVYAYRGEADKAFEWLDKAVEYKDPGLSEIVPERLFAKIHSDPRWLPFLRKLGKAPDQLAKIKFKVTLPKAWQTQAAAGDTAASRSASE